jgi:hypothetical protein
MSSYDLWRLACPYESDYGSPDVETVADFYGVDVEDVTDTMFANYAEDQREQDAGRNDC